MSGDAIDMLTACATSSPTTRRSKLAEAADEPILGELGQRTPRPGLSPPASTVPPR